MLRVLSIILFLFSTVLLSSCYNAYYRGNQAYAEGDYCTSFVNYLDAARLGVTPAQYNVGYQYYYGLGTKRDEVKAIHWFQRAAPNSVRAEYALQLIKEHRPPQPWVYGLEKQLNQNHRPKACVINVHCLD